MKENIIGALAVLAFLGVLILGATRSSNLVSNGSTSFGVTTATNMLAENYIPYVLYNGGYNSAKDINTSAYLGTTGTFQVGSSGTTQANQIVTTCSMQANNAPNGTTTQYAYCTGVTGITSSDTISASFSTSSTLFSDGWVIEGARASSTAGAIDFALIGVASKAMSQASSIGSTTVIRAGR